MTHTASPRPRATDERWREAAASVTVEIGRTEGKGSAMLTGIGIPFAAVVAAVPSVEFSGAGAVLAGVGIVGLVVGLVIALLLIQPTGLHRRVPGTFLYWATASDDEIVEDLAAAEHRPATLRNRSQLAKRKFMTASLAGYVVIVAVVALGAALLTTL